MKYDFFNIYDENIKEFYLEVAEEIIKSNNMQKMKEFVQHGDTSCYLHSLAVAYISLVIVRKFNIKCDEKSLIRGALLHDYFLYDWHKREESLRFHGFVHPKKALENAKKEFSLNNIEKDIIVKHMFPLTVLPPKYREGVIVSIVDKMCSISETFKFMKNMRNEVLNVSKKVLDV